MIKDEQALVKACKQGDRKALGELIKRFQKNVYATALRMLKDPVEAEECTQDIFLKIIKKIRTFRGDSKLSTWIYRIAVHTCINRLKASKRRNKKTESTEISLPQSMKDPSPGPEALAEKHHLLKKVQEELNSLSDDQRTILILGDIEGLDYKEIAEILQIPLGTAKSRLHRARCALRDKLTEYLSDTGGNAQ